MNTKVTINGGVFDRIDIEEMNSLCEKHAISFNLLEAHNFLPPEVLLILIEVGKEVGSGLATNALYDVLKLTLRCIIEKLSSKRPEQKTQMEIVCNDKRHSFSCNFQLTEEQKDKLIDAFAQKLSS